MLGKEAAMACTEAVETEIGDHYNNQVRALLQWQRDMEVKGQDIGDELRELITTIKRIRDEELEHLDHAVEHDSKEAQPYEPLVQVIRGGCRAAIWASERV
jgi:ubiquinone biosynthesis monooxygenase Coq7